MILIKKININITPNNFKFYNNLGYNCKVKDNIQININDLNKNSHIKIPIKCDNCGNEKMKPYREYLSCINNNKYYCTHCINKRLESILLEKYGKENSSKLDFVKEKKREKIKNYININFLKCDKNYEKIKKTFQTKYSLLFLKKSNLIHNYTYDYSKVNYINNKTKVIISCKIHGDFLQRPDMHLIGQGCPKCNISKNEQLIKNFLLSNSLNFIHQMKFENCKYKKELIFDFYLPNKSTCIEYDGEQHFIPIYGKEKLEEIKKRDKIKNIYCIKNNISLIRIKYNEDIYEKLKIIL